MSIATTRLNLLRDLLSTLVFEGSAGVPFHLHELIGEGGQGWVFKATYDASDGPWVAVKMLRPDVVNEEALSRFLREADVLRKLGQAQAPCPMVVRFFDHGVLRFAMPDGEVYGLPFTVIEFVQGTTLAHLIARQDNKGLPVVQVRRLFGQVVRGLSTVHAAHIVHRDLKPSNILVASDGGHEVAKLSDFGLVKRFDIDVKGTMALAGASIGYAPPEQFEHGNKRVSARTDVFALAAVLFEALSGQQAFPSEPKESPMQLLSRLLTGPRPQLASLASSLAPELASNPSLLGALDREIARALLPDPEHRHASVQAFWAAVAPHLRAAENRELAAVASDANRQEGLVPGEPDAPTDCADTAPVSVPDGGFSTALGRTQRQRLAGSNSLVLACSILAPGPFQEPARSISFSPDGRSAIALVGRAMLWRFSAGVWSMQRVPQGLALDAARGVLAMPGGEVMIFGERGLLWGVSADGTGRPWAQPSDQIAWSSASFDASGTEVTLLGEAAGGAALLGLLRAGQPLLVRGLNPMHAPLCAAARLATGDFLLSGLHGALFLLHREGLRPISWGKSGHLWSMLPLADGGAFVAGSGGHLLAVSATGEAKLEPVQTTRDVHCLLAGAGGVAFAGGAEGRLVRRGPGGWMRIALPPGCVTNIRALAARPGVLTVVLDDGTVIEAKD